ncbi:terpene synthase [Apiospora marii]|uniref:Terpene synthase n=1 Tax=Apiospora marii TaxID=335849 RepID=A0ABR1RZV0_9PEZI
MSSAKPDSANSRVTVSLPDMFKGFLVGDPTVNPFYEDARAESEKWLQSAMALSPKQAKRVQYCNFTYFVAVLIPHAPKERLKIASDWGNWIFMFDDMFDEGELRDDPDTSQRIVHNLLSIMGPERQRTSEEPVVMAHDSFYQQFARNCSPIPLVGVLGRYVEAMKSYSTGCLQHVADFTADQTPTILEMVKTRRMSIGVFPMYPLIEFAYDLNLPDEVFLDPTVQKLENLGAEFVMLMNDILSYPKEESEDCPFNTVAVCRMNGASAQQAFDEIASMVDARFSAWDEAAKALPSWGAEVDAQLHQYVQGIQNIVQANISWR